MTDLDNNELENALKIQINLSKKRLQINNLETVLIHDAFKIHKNDFYFIGQTMEKLRKTLKFKKWGISVYSPNEFYNLLQKHNFQVVQMPLNILDQRALEHSVIWKCKEANIEFQARSVFLQGLLIQNEIKNCYLNNFSDLIKFKRWCFDNKCNPLDACISFIKSINTEFKIVVGFRSLKEVKQIINSFNNFDNIYDFKELSSDNIELIDPRNWKL